jgi:hypothetical protein
MFHITSSLFGGLAAVAAWALVAPSFNPPPAQPVADQTAPVNRTAKGDRLAPVRLPGADHKVATVEVVGIRDAAIVYRDRDGRVLFETDPLSNVTVVSRGFVLPQLTVRETSRSSTAPVEPMQEFKARPPIPIGCEPLASPIAQPRLAHMTGRCLS